MTTTVAERKAQLITDVVTVVDETVGLRPWEKEELIERLSEPNFFEYWTNGVHRSSSYKVYIDSGVPYIVDQYNRRDMIKVIIAANEKIKALFV